MAWVLQPRHVVPWQIGMKALDCPQLPLYVLLLVLAAV
jgi:hypothetical protein